MASILDELQIPYIKPLDRQFFKCISGLLAHPWWTRVWIMQEATAIRLTYVLYGTRMAWLYDISPIFAITILPTFSLIRDVDSYHLDRIQTLERIFLLSSRRPGKLNTRGDFSTYYNSSVDSNVQTIATLFTPQ